MIGRRRNLIPFHSFLFFLSVSLLVRVHRPALKKDRVTFPQGSRKRRPERLEPSSSEQSVRDGAFANTILVRRFVNVCVPVQKKLLHTASTRPLATRCRLKTMTVRSSG